MALINRTEVKKIVGDFKTATEFYSALNIKVEKLLLESMERAKANQRRTLMARDL